MSIVATLLASGTDTTNPQTTVTTSSVSPSTNSTLILFVWVRGQPASTPTISGGGLTWSIERREDDVFGVATLFVCSAYGSASSGSVTFTRGGTDTWFQSDHALVEVTGTASSGYVVQSASTSAETATDPFAVTYGSGFGAGNGGVAAFLIRGGNYASTPRSGWTELADFGIPAGINQMAVHWRADSDTAASANYGGGAGTVIKYAAAVEIKAASAGPVSHPYYFRLARNGGLGSGL